MLGSVGAGGGARGGLTKRTSPAVGDEYEASFIGKGGEGWRRSWALWTEVEQELLLDLTEGKDGAAGSSRTRANGFGSAQLRAAAWTL